MRPPEEVYGCPTCRKTLRHDRRYCPLFPDPPPSCSDGEPGKKWDRCVCLVHTCYRKGEQ